MTWFHLLAIPALVPDGAEDNPAAATQYCVIDPDGERHVYGDQTWVKYGGPLRDVPGHAGSHIQHRTITITYGEWRDGAHEPDVTP